MASTASRTGNRFIVIDPAPSPEDFFAGDTSIRNEHDLEVTLTSSDTDISEQATFINGIVILNLQPVHVKMDFGHELRAYATGTYKGAGSELWLTM